MFDATKLLGEFMQGRAVPSAPGRMDAAAAQTGAEGGSMGSLLSGLGGSGGLAGLLGQLTGGMQQAAGSARTEVEANNPVAVGGLGALAGALLGGGKGAVGGGIMAVLGSLAVSALQTAAQRTTQPAPLAAPAATPATGFAEAPVGYAAVPASHEDPQATARLLLRAMISAAKADGQIDTVEMDKIMAKLHEQGSDPAAQQFVLQEMSKPLDLAGLAAEAQSPALAVQVYAASLLAIEVDTQAEQNYLATLAQALHLQPESVSQIHRVMGVST